MIKKRMVIILFLFVLFAAVIKAETKITPIPNLLKPELIFLDKTQMYVTEGVSIYIYSLKDFKLIKRFGKRGEGPQEFMVNPLLSPLFINVQTGDIIVSSFGKLSRFTKQGKYKTELKLPDPFISGIQPFGKNLVGIRFTIGEQRWLILNLYDDKLNELKEITKQEHLFQPGKGTLIMEAQPFTVIYDNKLFLAWENALKIKVLDSKLNELHTVKYPIEKQVFTEEIKKEVINFLKTDPSTKNIFEFLKPIKFTTHLPAIQNLVVTGNKIFIMTFKSDKADNTELLIFNTKGKFLKQVFFPLKMSTPIQPYPYTIHETSLYQLVEDVGEEEWNIHVTEIK